MRRVGSVVSVPCVGSRFGAMAALAHGPKSSDLGTIAIHCCRILVSFFAFNHARGRINLNLSHWAHGILSSFRHVHWVRGSDSRCPWKPNTSCRMHKGEEAGRGPEASATQKNKLPRNRHFRTSNEHSIHNTISFFEAPESRASARIISKRSAGKIPSQSWIFRRLCAFSPAHALQGAVEGR